MRHPSKPTAVLATTVATLVLLSGGSAWQAAPAHHAVPPQTARELAPVLPSMAGQAPAAASLTGANAKWFNLTGGLHPAPPPQYGGEMTYDAKDGYVLYFSGTNATDASLTATWAYRDGVWSQLPTTIAPSGRIGFVLVYDPVDQCVVLFGGISASNSTIYGDTWEFAGGIWTNVTTGTGPSPRVDPSAEWDPDVQSVVLFGGQNLTVFYGDTWRFVGGTWTEIFPPSSPSPRVAPALTYDVADGYLLLFGGVDMSTNFSDTYKFSNGTWTELFPASAPTGRAVWQSVYDVSLGAVLVFGGGTGDDALYFGDTWTFHAGQWTEQFPVSSPGAREFAAMAWDPPDDYAFTFGGEGQASNATQFLLEDAWAYVAAPSVTVAPVSGARDIGQSVSLSATVSGGVPPYTVAWTYGDGMSGAGLSTSHVYGTAGTFSVGANVTDAFDQSALGSRAVTVYASPTVAVTVNDTAPTVGDPVTLTAAVTGGAPPVTFAWSFGDGGTSSQAGPLSHTYNATGTITVNLTVTDAAGEQSSGVASLTVHPRAAAGSSSPSLGFGLIALVVVVLVVIAAVVLLAYRRRRRSPAPPPGAAPPVGWTPPPPPPPPPS